MKKTKLFNPYQTEKQKSKGPKNTHPRNLKSYGRRRLYDTRKNKR